MIYITGDCHGEYRKFTKKQRLRLPFCIGEGDYVIVCGDMAILWDVKDKVFEYNIDWLSRLPFTLLFVDGNHEGFTLLNEYPVEEWNGGKVHHIVKDKIIHLMRGQIFNIDGKKIFTFGGASSHDMEGGILDKSSPDYEVLKQRAKKRKLNCRVLNETWWEAELPTEEELQEGRDNLQKADWKVDYVISHCCATSIQNGIEKIKNKVYGRDILTDYFEELENMLCYEQWYCGHYHINKKFDEKHTILYEDIIQSI